MPIFADFFNAFTQIPDVPAFLYASLMVILGLILIEGLLSVDNALGMAAMVAHLPKHQQKPALRWGLIGAYTFRAIALALVAWLMHNQYVKWFGAAYLIFLACDHLSYRHHEAHKKEGAVSGAAGVGFRAFITTIASIELMDLSLSLDNVIAAVGMVNGVQEIPEELHLFIVCIGVFIGIAALRLVAGWCVGVLEKYPVLGYTAFILVGFVGVTLCLEMGLEHADIHWHLGIVPKFCCIVSLVALSLLYERSAALHAVLRPFVVVFRACSTALAVSVKSVLMPWRLFRKNNR